MPGHRATLSFAVIPIIDLSAENTELKEELEAAVSRVIASGKYVLGPEVGAFEDEFANLCGTKYAVGVNSGTSALYLSLLAAGIGQGDEVITVPFTFEATISAIKSTGAKARLVDIDSHSLTIDVNKIERAINPETKAILPVHLFGQPAQMDRILEIAARYGLLVIEDACQAHGATYHGNSIGGLGDLGCFSFYPTKNLGTLGEGGIVVTNNTDFAESLRKLRSWGNIQNSGNFRMSAIQASMLRIKLPHLHNWISKRQAIADQYRASLNKTELLLPQVMANTTHAFNIYGVRSPKRDLIARTLNSQQIGTGIHYKLPLHLDTRYVDLGYDEGDFPVAEKVSREQLSLPIYPGLSKASVKTITETVKQCL